LISVPGLLQAHIEKANTGEAVSIHNFFMFFMQPASGQLVRPLLWQGTFSLVFRPFVTLTIGSCNAAVIFACSFQIGITISDSQLPGLEPGPTKIATREDNRDTLTLVQNGRLVEKALLISRDICTLSRS
jgi:hypothetical protein